MNRKNLFISLFLAFSMLIVQVGGVLAAPGAQAMPPVKGILQKITLETDPSTIMTTVLLEVRTGNDLQTVELSQETALKLGFIGLDGDGKPVINEKILGKHVQIDGTDILPLEEAKTHPVGSALARFFSSSMDAEEAQIYSTIMEAHDQGLGFGVIAQVLWLTQQIPGGGDVDDFQALLTARQRGIFTDLPFVDENGVTITPRNWGELKNAILSGRPVVNLGSVMSNKNDNEANQKNDHNDNKDKNREKNNSGNGADKEKEKKK